MHTHYHTHTRSLSLLDCWTVGPGSRWFADLLGTETLKPRDGTIPLKTNRPNYPLRSGFDAFRIPVVVAERNFNRRLDCGDRSNECLCLAPRLRNYESVVLLVLAIWQQPAAGVGRQRQHNNTRLERSGSRNNHWGGSTKKLTTHPPLLLGVVALFRVRMRARARGREQARLFSARHDVIESDTALLVKSVAAPLLVCVSEEADRRRCCWPVGCCCV